MVESGGRREGRWKVGRVGEVEGERVLAEGMKRGWGMEREWMGDRRGG